VRVVDFGTRGHDLAYTVLDGYDVLILVDATARGGAAGTLSVLELDPNEAMNSANSAPAGGHSLDLPGALRLVRDLGGTFPRLYLIGCEPAELGSEEGVMSLSDTVRNAIERAVELVTELVAEVRAQTPTRQSAAV
jgi:hydrogenase maturation protease